MPPLQENPHTKHLWHPCAQMKDYESFPPLQVHSAKGSIIHLENGHQLIDAISSWWCKSLGHGHPTIQKRVREQMDRFEHVILANTTNDAIVDLSAKLCSIHPDLTRVFYAGDGSSAVEIALKMSVHAQQHLGRPHRTHFAGLSGGYHGETALTLGVSDCDLYKAPYRSLAPQGTVIQTPTCSGPEDPMWSASWSFDEQASALNSVADSLAAVIIEPIVQGAGGMRIIPPSFLQALEKWCRSNDIFLIADEIMSGFGRTGKLLASEHAGLSPDFVCWAKGLNGGYLPFSAMLTKEDIYQLFYDDYESGKAFLHSNTYTGNALGVASALGTWEALEQEQTLQNIPKLQKHMMGHLQNIASATGRLKNLRGIGGLVAADLHVEDLPSGRWGYQIYREAVQRGALLRPLGNTLYWLPPLNTPLDLIDQLSDITSSCLQSVLPPL